MPTVFLNGSFLERDDARVSAFDAGFQHAVGLFETMLAYTDGPPTDDLSHVSIVGLEAHIERISQSAKALSLSDNLNAAALAEAVVETFARSGLDRARLRLTITGGDLNLLERTGGRTTHNPTVLIVAQPATTYPPEMFDRGVMVTIADWRTNPLDPHASHKTLDYWPRLRELQVAAGKGAAEALVLQVTNHVAGGCVSNLFLVRDGKLITPTARGEEPTGSLPSPVLPGTTRARILELAEEEGLEIERRLVSVADVLDANEAFLTNSSWGILPVTRLEAEPIGQGTPGATTRRLRERLSTERGESVG